MRKADRLFEIIQILRRSRGPVTADAIAAELETSKRSVYRDISALTSQRVPIRGEAGLGYVLEKGFDLPPLMLTSDEIEAVALGAQWVETRGDPILARAAQDVLAKIEATIPEALRPYLAEPSGGVMHRPPQAVDGIDGQDLRAAIRAGNKIRIAYEDVNGVATERVIWPVIIGYLEAVRILAAWCELRQDFRNFRTDRVKSATVLDEKYRERPAILRARWRRHVEAELKACRED